jgi:hypothetical protein
MESPEKFCVYECAVSSYWFDGNGFLWARSKNVIHTRRKSKAAFELIRHLTDNQRVCLVLDLSCNSLVMLDEKSKEFIASELPEMFRAVAVLAPTTLQKVAPTIFLNTVGQPVPIKIVDTEQEAVEWLKWYMEHA